MFTDMFCRFLILQTLVLGALCCMCVRNHPQKHFCENKFVLKMKIHEEIDLPVGYGFRAEIKKVFKGDVQELNITEDRYVNLEMPPACNIDYMKTGQRFVIFGNNKNGSIFTDICNGNIHWSMTSKYYKRGLRKHYKTGCDCIDELELYSKCHWKYSVLKRNDGNCNWVKTDFLQKCLKGNAPLE